MSDAPATAAPPAPPQRMIQASIAGEAHEAFELMELEDERLVLAELAGRVVDTYIYEPKYKDGRSMLNERGDPVIGLSFSGVNWACREFARKGEAIRIVTKPEIQPDPFDAEFVIISVVAQRFAVNIETGKEVALDSSVGVKRQGSQMQKKDGTVVFDQFWAEKGTSKAQRNAKQALLPTDFVKSMIKKALELKKNPTETRSRQPGKTAAATTKPQGAAAPPPPPGQKSPAAAAPPPLPGQAAKPPAGQTQKTDLGALRQKFWAVLKQATSVQGKPPDEPTARTYLKALAGKDKVSDLTEATLRALGAILRGVVESVNLIQADPATGKWLITDQTSGALVWPAAAAAPPPPAAQPPPAAEEPPAASPQDEPPPTPSAADGAPDTDAESYF